MKKHIWMAVFCLAFFSFVSCREAHAQESPLGPKTSATTSVTTRETEIDHMQALIVRLKADTLSIQDPAAKRAAMDNLDLWQHILDRLLLENKDANNTGSAHHHPEGSEPASRKTSEPPAPSTTPKP